MTEPAAPLKLLGTPRGFPALPVAWDGIPVRWEAWEERIRTSLELCNGATECEGCGLGSSLWTSTGLWRRREGLRIRGPELAELHATRCGWCGHTTVYTMHDGKVWTLDESDYTEHGSFDCEEARRLF